MIAKMYTIVVSTNIIMNTVRQTITRLLMMSMTSGKARKTRPIRATRVRRKIFTTRSTDAPLKSAEGVVELRMTMRVRIHVSRICWVTRNQSKTNHLSTRGCLLLWKTPKRTLHSRTK